MRLNFTSFPTTLSARFSAHVCARSLRHPLPLVLGLTLLLTGCGGPKLKGSTTPPPPEKVKADAKAAYDNCVKQAKEKDNGETAVLQMCELLRKNMERHAEKQK